MVFFSKNFFNGRWSLFTVTFAEFLYWHVDCVSFFCECSPVQLWSLEYTTYICDGVICAITVLCEYTGVHIFWCIHVQCVVCLGVWVFQNVQFWSYGGSGFQYLSPFQLALFCRCHQCFRIWFRCNFCIASRMLFVSAGKCLCPPVTVSSGLVLLLVTSGNHPSFSWRGYWTVQSFFPDAVILVSNFWGDIFPVPPWCKYPTLHLHYSLFLWRLLCDPWEDVSICDSVYSKITCAFVWFLWCWYLFGRLLLFNLLLSYLFWNPFLWLYRLVCWYPLLLLLSLLKFCLFWLLSLLLYLWLLLKFGLEFFDELCHKLYEFFLLLLEDLLKDPLKKPSAALLVDLVLIVLMSQSWNESSSSLIFVSIFVASCSLYLSDAASTKEDSLLISIACLKASSSDLM